MNSYYCITFRTISLRNLVWKPQHKGGIKLSLERWRNYQTIFRKMSISTYNVNNIKAEEEITSGFMESETRRRDHYQSNVTGASYRRSEGHSRRGNDQLLWSPLS